MPLHAACCQRLLRFPGAVPPYLNLDDWRRACDESHEAMHGDGRSVAGWTRWRDLPTCLPAVENGAIWSRGQGFRKVADYPGVCRLVVLIPGLVLSERWALCRYWSATTLG
jgi:hypothetical protein